MGESGQSWPYTPSVSGQSDYWNLDMVNLAVKDEESEKKKKELRRRYAQQVRQPNNKIKRLESDMFSKNKVARLEDDFWRKNKKIPKPLNNVKKILRNIL